MIGGVAPFDYIAKLEKGTSTSPSMTALKVDELVTTHLIDVQLLRRNEFVTFMDDRRKRLLALIQEATGKAAYLEKTLSDDDGEIDAPLEEASLTMKAA